MSSVNWSSPGDPPGYTALPPGSMIELPGKGQLFVRDQSGPLDRPALLLLHGLTSTADLCWFATFPRLRDRHRVVAPDLRGHGAGLPARGSNLEEVADDMAGLIDELALGKVIVVGYSMGGVVAQLLWLRHRSTVAGLVLCATAATFRPPDAKGRAALAARRALLTVTGAIPADGRRRLEGQIRRVGLRRTIDDRPPEALRSWVTAQVRRNPPLGVLAATVALRSTSTEAWIGRIDVPTSCVIPTLDTVVPIERQEALARSIHGCIVVRLHADHGGFAQYPDDFAAAILSGVEAVTDRM